MALGEALGPIGGGLLRVVAAIFGKTKVEQKNLQARIGMRAIVSELPSNFLFKIVDQAGHTHSGVYALNVLIWNKGTQEVLPSDFLDSAPLRLSIDKNAYIISVDLLSNDDQLVCAASQLDTHSVDIQFDCINPGDYINVVLFYGGKSMADVEILGRIRGQATSIDHQAEEVKAGIGERLLNLSMLLFVVNMFVGLPISAWLIYRDHGFLPLFEPRPDIPSALAGSFGLGLTFVAMFVWSRIGRFLERRKYPPGYPLYSDFEPPFAENIKGMILTAFTAKKQRLSTSLFDWAQPVILRQKRSKRRSVDDWIA
jgi:hypothetical protein